jgi:hypothetical protein
MAGPSAEVFAEGRQKVITSGVDRFDWQFQGEGGKLLLLDVILHAVQMGGGEIVHGIFRDVTAERLAARELDSARLTAESSLRHLSRQDALTGLPNRALFLEDGQRRLDASPSSENFSLLYIDVDNFRRVNDVLGEAAGTKCCVRSASVCATSQVPATSWPDWEAMSSHCC